MKAKYNAEVDALTIRFADAKIVESDKQKQGIYDKEGEF